MLAYVIKRLLLLPLLLFVFSIVAFVLIQAPPGDFVTSYVAELAASGSSMDQLQIEALRSLYGLDQPMYVQYFKWIARILQGDFGVSLDWQKPISELIGERLMLTLALGLFTLLFTFAVAVPVGIISATRQYSFYDYFFTMFSYIGVATPSFMTALVLMWLAFSYFNLTITGLFSPAYVDALWSFDRVVDLGKHIWLPVVIHGLDRTARLARIMRANLLDELHKPYVEMAPRHPYTAALMLAVPVADPRIRSGMTPLRGEVPSPANPPSGCYFHPRCPYAIDICTRKAPPLEEISPGRLVSCHRAHELTLAGIGALHRDSAGFDSPQKPTKGLSTGGSARALPVLVTQIVLHGRLPNTLFYTHRVCDVTTGGPLCPCADLSSAGSYKSQSSQAPAAPR